MNDKKCSVCGGGKNIDDGDNCYHVCEHCFGTGIEPVKVEPETQLSDLDSILEKYRVENNSQYYYIKNDIELKHDINEWHKQEMVKLIDEEIAQLKKYEMLLEADYNAKVTMREFKQKILQGKSK